MDEFRSYLFKEDEIRTNNKRVIKERTYYVGLLIALVGLILYLFDIDYGAGILVTGGIILTLGRIVMSGRAPSIGHRPLELKIRSNSIVIGNEEIDLSDKGQIFINIVGYRGQGMIQRTAFYKAHSGNDNTIRLWYKDKEAMFKFVLDSEHQKDKLLKFCDTHGFNVSK